MKKSVYTIAAVCLMLLTASCGILNKKSDHSLYNKHNREKVKIKDGLFSAKKVFFGIYSTTSIEDGVNKSIVSLSHLHQPFHFTLMENEANTVSVQAANTDKESLKDKTLPESFSQSASKKIFYAWISGSTANNLNNWELILKNPSYEELAKNDIVGVLRSSEEDIDVHANSRSGDIQSYDALCYEFQLKGIPIAAVQVAGKRKYVWMQQTLKKDIKNAVTGAIAALLLK